MSFNAEWRRWGTCAVVAATVVLNFTAVTLAQDNAVRPPVLPPQQPGTGVPEKVDPPLGSTQGSEATGTLSEKLSKSEGVIQPPDGVDPAIRVAPPPAGGTMPVIPPPGEPGGNPSVQPK